MIAENFAENNLEQLEDRNCVRGSDGTIKCDIYHLSWEGTFILERVGIVYKYDRRWAKFFRHTLVFSGHTLKYLKSPSQILYQAGNYRIDFLPQDHVMRKMHMVYIHRLQQIERTQIMITGGKISFEPGAVFINGHILRLLRDITFLISCAFGS